MLLSNDVESSKSKSHSPFRGVAGKQTFFERPDNEKEYSQDDMSLKDERNYKNFQFGEEPYVPVAVAKKHISMMEADMRRMKENYGKTMKDLEAGYLKLEETTRQIYKRTLGVWKNKAKNKIKQFQDALKKAIQERNEIETNLKERLKKTRIEKERLDKEKIFLLSENEAGREQIQEKARLLDEIKNTYQVEIKEKENIIDQREEQIEKMKDEQEQFKAKTENEKQALIEQNQKEIAEVKLKLENETSKREQLEITWQRLQEEGVIPVGVVAPVSISRQGTRTKDMLRQKSEHFEEDKSEGEASNLESLMAVKRATHESSKNVNVVPVGAAAIVGASSDSKELLERIDKLETENAQLQEDKIELAKAIKNMDELIKEFRNKEKVYQQQIADAEKQGANIIPAEVIEENNKVALKRSKTKKKGRKRANEVESDEEEEENEVFAKNEELKKIVDSLVPEEQKDDHVEEAKRIMMIQSSKNEDLAKEVSRLSRENSLLEKSLIELKKRSNDEGGLTLDSLAEENKALISQIKNLKKEMQEIKSSVAEGSLIKDTHISKDESHLLDQRNKTEDGDAQIVTLGNVDGGLWQQWEQYKESIRDLEDKVAILEEENLHIKSDLAKAEEQATKLDSDLTTLRLEYAQLASEKPSKGGKADQVLKQQLEQLMVENQDLKEQNKQIGSKTQPTKRLEVKLDKKDREIEKLQKDIEELKSK